ncbi:MAG: bifunctional diaminohydroxyphosphoribosylaminopyrimidine deaminase/5-amino-6-(5-phosphoribosylamino)uracil reductase RibD [Alicyclobacillaceae bacterium]|nr:bifunctional diaminohydroxyphosphoribosylaminopyrimidine deaminase/5-amino-6-(5-phosphoribosylamino)uracil reductase RibD [Alicyclobacillaceae bacterium]
MTDEEWMRWALRLAASARGQTSPNPMVGAVIVKDGEIVGQGAHLKAGGPHAEIHALRMAGERARGGVMYVTLEPCDHHGRTPPCSLAVIEHGIARVVVAMADPNPLVAGRGIARLRDAGISVTVGVLEEEARALNRGFIKRMTEGRPWVIAKLAMTLDAQAATWTGQSKWITGEQARHDVHRLRSQVDAIVTGVGTVMADDPQLTVRIPGETLSRQPLRVVLDSRLQTPEGAKILDVSEAPTVICARRDLAPKTRVEILQQRGVEVWLLDGGPEGGVELVQVFRRLAERGVNTVMVEAGGRLQGSIMRAGLVDQVIVYMAPTLLMGSGLPAIAGRGVDTLDRSLPLEIESVERIGKDLKVTAFVRPSGESG